MSFLNLPNLGPLALCTMASLYKRTLLEHKRGLILLRRYKPRRYHPIDGKCLHECIAYQANAITNNECKEYFGTAEREFKLRHNNHTMSFRRKKRVKI